MLHPLEMEGAAASKIPEVKGLHKATILPKWKAAVNAFAMSLLKERYPNGLLYFGILLTDEAWAELNPIDPRPQFPQYPAMHGANASQAAISIYKEEKEAALAVSRAMTLLVAAMLGALDSVDLGSLFHPETGHANLSPADVMKFMVEAHGTITDSDVEYVKDQTTTTFNPSVWGVPNWLADKVQNYAFLQSIDCETSAPDQYRNLLSSARNSPALKKIIEKYISDTDMADRNFVHLKSFLITQWAKVQTTGNPIRAAFAGRASVAEDHVNESDDEDPGMPVVFAAAASARSIDECEKEIAALKGSLKVAKFYCFTCGHCGHAGTRCKKMTSHDATGTATHPKPRIVRSPYTLEMLNATEPKSIKDANGKLCKGNPGVEKGYRKA